MVRHSTVLIRIPSNALYVLGYLLFLFHHDDVLQFIYLLQHNIFMFIFISSLISSGI